MKLLNRVPIISDWYPRVGQPGFVRMLLKGDIHGVTYATPTKSRFGGEQFRTGTHKLMKFDDALILHLLSGVLLELLAAIGVNGMMCQVE